MNADDDKTLCLYLINKMLWNSKIPKPGSKGQNQAYVTKIRAKLKKRTHGPSM